MVLIFGKGKRSTKQHQNEDTKSHETKMTNDNWKMIQKFLLLILPRSEVAFAWLAAIQFCLRELEMPQSHTRIACCATSTPVLTKQQSNFQRSISSRPLPGLEVLLDYESAWRRSKHCRAHSAG